MMVPHKTLRPLLLACVAGFIGFLVAMQAPKLGGADTSSVSRLKVGGATITVSIASGRLDLPQSSILRWITRAATAGSVYYGRFPVETVQLRVHPENEESGVFNGTTWGYEGGFTRISVGQHTTERQLDSDWMLTHEFIHMAFPDLPDQHHWMEEG